jgi:hypothetical protein
MIDHFIEAGFDLLSIGAFCLAIYWGSAILTGAA